MSEKDRSLARMIGTSYARSIKLKVAGDDNAYTLLRDALMDTVSAIQALVNAKRLTAITDYATEYRNLVLEGAGYRFNERAFAWEKVD